VIRLSHVCADEFVTHDTYVLLMSVATIITSFICVSVCVTESAGMSCIPGLMQHFIPTFCFSVCRFIRLCVDLKLKVEVKVKMNSSVYTELQPLYSISLTYINIYVVYINIHNILDQSHMFF